jgi:hypothetical protein
VSRPHCIVCGKQIKKRFESISFLPASGNGRQNYDREGNTIYLEPPLRPKTKAECQRFTNHEVISVNMDSYTGHVWSFKWWEGEYEDEFFCTGSCARKQGYASARHGDRFTWRFK